jgi:phage terminase large subunit-like protein
MPRTRLPIETDLYARLPALLATAGPAIRRLHDDIVRARDDTAAAPTSIDAWAESRFYIPGQELPIRLAEHQRAILRLAFTRDADGRLPYRNVVYSTPKKSGKTATAGLVLRWYAETQGRHSELFAVGNDLDQAKGRAFAAARTSIELTPGYDARRDRLPGIWNLQQLSMRCLRTFSVIKALAVDARGEAGGAPAISCWTELWGFTSTESMRFWDELTPILTVPDSMRFVETYAGYEQESVLLKRQYNTGLAGRQLSVGELASRTGTSPLAWHEAQHPDDPVPVWENKNVSQLTYWDTGTNARRMPWQHGPEAETYYRTEEASMTPDAFRRLHENAWVSVESAFIPPELWDACYDPEILPLDPSDRTPVVIGVDAATTFDCFAIVAVTRHPDPDKHDHIAVRALRVFDPKEHGGQVDYDEAEAFLRFVAGGGHVIHGAPGQEPVLHPRTLAAVNAEKGCVRCAAGDFDIPGNNVVQICFDPFQLEATMQRLRRDSVAWCEPFSQQQDRMKADRQLYDLIVTRRLHHMGNTLLRDHVLNAGAKLQKDEGSTLRLVKIADYRKIDAAVALSMASARALYLTI